MLDTFLDNVLEIGGKWWNKACTEFHEGIWEVKVQELYEIILSDYSTDWTMIYLFSQIKRSQIPAYEVNSDPFFLCEGHNIHC